MTKRSSQFQLGSGVYQCRCCKRMTRGDGSFDSVGLELCSLCYEYGGIENTISDNGSTPELEAELEALRKKIIAKGGVL